MSVILGSWREEADPKMRLECTGEQTLSICRVPLASQDELGMPLQLGNAVLGAAA